MGLDTSHDCWHGPYSAFMRWRKMIAHAAGLPPLELMEGFYMPPDNGLSCLYHGPQSGKDGWLNDLTRSLPLKWDCLKPSPLHLLLSHSDCDGNLRWQDCNAIADSLEALEVDWDDWLAVKTAAFIDGLRRAAKSKENVDFH